MSPEIWRLLLWTLRVRDNMEKRLWAKQKPIRISRQSHHCSKNPLRLCSSCSGPFLSQRSFQAVSTKLGERSLGVRMQRSKSGLRIVSGRESQVCIQARKNDCKGKFQFTKYLKEFYDQRILEFRLQNFWLPKPWMSPSFGAPKTQRPKMSCNLLSFRKRAVSALLVSQVALEVMDKVEPGRGYIQEPRRATDREAPPKQRNQRLTTESLQAVSVLSHVPLAFISTWRNLLTSHTCNPLPEVLFCFVLFCFVFPWLWEHRGRVGNSRELLPLEGTLDSCRRINSPLCWGNQACSTPLSTSMGCSVRRLCWKWPDNPAFIGLLLSSVSLSPPCHFSDQLLAGSASRETQIKTEFLTLSGQGIITMSSEWCEWVPSPHF